MALLTADATPSIKDLFQRELIRRRRPAIDLNELALENQPRPVEEQQFPRNATPSRTRDVYAEIADGDPLEVDELPQGHRLGAGYQNWQNNQIAQTGIVPGSGVSAARLPSSAPQPRTNHLDPENIAALRKKHGLDYRRDDQGEVVRDESGNPVTSPRDNEALAPIDEVTLGRPAKPELSPERQAYRDRMDAEREEKFGRRSAALGQMRQNRFREQNPILAMLQDSSTPDPFGDTLPSTEAMRNQAFVMSQNPHPAARAMAAQMYDRADRMDQQSNQDRTFNENKRQNDIQTYRIMESQWNQQVADISKTLGIPWDQAVREAERRGSRRPTLGGIQGEIAGESPIPDGAPWDDATGEPQAPQLDPVQGGQMVNHARDSAAESTPDKYLADNMGRFEQLHPADQQDVLRQWPSDQLEQAQQRLVDDLQTKSITEWIAPNETHKKEREKKMKSLNAIEARLGMELTTPESIEQKREERRERDRNREYDTQFLISP